MFVECLRNFFVSIYGKLSGNAYITYHDGYPHYHYSKKQREHNAQVEAKKEARRHQILSFTLEDMFEYDDIPFLWNKDLFYSNGYAYLPLTEENREIAIYYINQIANLIHDARRFVPHTESCIIKKKDIDFNYPLDMTIPVPPCTFLECTPFTPTGKKSKYPVTLHFATSQIQVSQFGSKLQLHPVMGKIKILCDGNIGAASVIFAKNYTKFSISLFGLSLVVRRVDSDMGNLFKFENIK